MNKKSLNNNLNEALSVKDKKDLLKDKDFQDEVVKITSNVLTQLYKTLWTKRNFWKSSIKNKAS